MIRWTCGACKERYTKQSCSFWPRYAPNGLLAGALPQTPLEELTALPQILNWFRGWGHPGKGRGSREERGRERERKGGEEKGNGKGKGEQGEAEKGKRKGQQEGEEKGMEGMRGKAGHPQIFRCIDAFG